MSFDVFYMQILALGLLILAAHFGGKLTRLLRIGVVVGQVLGGLVVGPLLVYLLEHRAPAYRQALNSLHFFTFIFLSIIAFGIGDELTLDKLKKLGKSSLAICLIQALVTWALITGTFFLLGFKPIVALIIGSIGIATAPAVTFVIMNRLDIGGKMRSMVGGIVVLDDVFEVVVFSVICQIALLLQGQCTIRVGGVAWPVLQQFGLAILLGFGIFIALRLTVERKWLKPKRNHNGYDAVLGPEFLSRLISEMPGPSVEIFILVAGCVSLGVGLALHWHLPFLITAVGAGIFISNFYSPEVFKSLRVENATSMYTLVFFAIIGANTSFDAFHSGTLLWIGAYVAARGAGKIGGTWLGCKITRQEKRITQCLPRLMLPQAGVAAVEAFFVATVLGEDGKLVLSVILPGLIIFEIVGVLTSERALLRWRSWVTGGGDLLGADEIIREKIKTEKIPLSGIIDLECVKVPLRVESKGEAIWDLIRTLTSAGYITNPGEVLEVLLNRERQGGSTLGDGIAVPHGRIPGISRPAVALGILPRGGGIIFGGRGDIPIDIIFMVISPESKPETHLQILAAIARLLDNREARTRLRFAKDEEEAMEVIREYS